MTKISALPLLAAADVTGDETVPVIKDGETLRAPLDTLLAPAVEAAASSETAAANSAAAAEAFVGKVYASTAAGLAATIAGQQFAVSTVTDVIDIYLHAPDDTATFQRTGLTAAAVAAPGFARQIGTTHGTLQEVLDALRPNLLYSATEEIPAHGWINIYDNAGTRSIQKADADDPARPAHGFVTVAVPNGAASEIFTGGLNPDPSVNFNGPAWLSTVAGTATAAPLDPTSAGNVGKISQRLGTAIAGVGVLFTFQEPIEI